MFSEKIDFLERIKSGTLQQQASHPAEKAALKAVK